MKNVRDKYSGSRLFFLFGFACAATACTTQQAEQASTAAATFASDVAAVAPLLAEPFVSGSAPVVASAPQVSK